MHFRLAFMHRLVPVMLGFADEVIHRVDAFGHQRGDVLRRCFGYDHSVTITCVAVPVPLIAFM